METTIRIVEIDLADILHEADYHQARLSCPDTPLIEQRAAAAHLAYYLQLASRRRSTLAKLRGRIVEVRDA